MMILGLTVTALGVCMALVTRQVILKILERKRGLKKAHTLLTQARKCIKSDARQIRLRAGAKSNQIKRLVAKHKFSFEKLGTTQHELNLLFSRSLQIPKKVGLEYRLAEPQAIDLDESEDTDEEMKTTSLADPESDQLHQLKKAGNHPQPLARVNEPTKHHWDLTGVEQHDIHDFIERNFDRAVSR